MPAATTDLRVADLMTIDPVAIEADAPIEEAEELLRHHRVTGLPVIDSGGRLVGVVSQTDLLYLAIPSVKALIRHREGGIRVGEVMSMPAVTINSTTTLRDAARLMHRKGLHRLVSVDADQRPIGVISAMDFVAFAAEA